MGADSVAGRLVPGADFNCFEKDFSAIFKGISRVENEKMAAI